MRRTKRGNCYVTCEALWHLLGGKKSGWTPQYIKVGKETHWFLRHDIGIALDPTKKQFPKEIIISHWKAKGCGFLTKKPSKRARKLMQQMLWQ